MIYKATIDVFLDVEEESEACDGMAETMRDHLRRYAPESCIVDWSYHPDHPLPVPATQAEIDAFEPDNIEGVAAFQMTPTGLQSVTLAQAFESLVTPVQPATPVRASGDIIPNSRAAWTVAIENLIRTHLTDPVIGVVRPDTKTIFLSVGQDSGERRFVVRVSELRR